MRPPAELWDGRTEKEQREKGLLASHVSMQVAATAMAEVTRKLRLPRSVGRSGGRDDRATDERPRLESEGEDHQEAIRSTRGREESI